MQNTTRIVVCGCGAWGSNLLRNFSQLGALAGVVDSNVALAERTAQQFGVRSYNFQESLEDSTIDGIVIATPATTHAALAAQAIEAGKHVFVEKPLALNRSDAQMLAMLAQKHQSILMVGHLLHYHPAYRALKDAVASGAIGTIRYIESNRLSFGRVREDEDVLWSFAPHDISMILGLVGEMPKSIKANGQYLLGTPRADVVSLEIVFSNLSAKVNVSWMHPAKEHKLTVMGDKGMLVFDDGQDWPQKLLHYPHQVVAAKAIKGEAKPMALTPAEPLREECLHFLNSIHQKTSPLTDASEALRTLHVLEMASKALGDSTMKKLPYYVHDTAVVDEGASIGDGTKIWHFSHILSGSQIGANVSLGQNVVIGPNVSIGAGCKIQNNVSIIDGVTLEEAVFCGPSCVFTNVKNPRTEVNRRGEFMPTRVRRGATIGGNATIVCGNEIGEYAMIGAGAVVTHDVPAHALVVGNPARQIGWVSHSGERLPENLVCPRDGRRYRVSAQGTLEEIIVTASHG